MEARSVSVVGEASELAGFRLGGVGKVLAVTSSNIDEVVARAGEAGGLVLVTKRAGELVGEKIALIEKNAVTLTLPDSEQDGSARLRELIRETIGFDVRRK